MPTKPQSNDSCSSVTTEAAVSGRAKLGRLKAQLFPPENEPARVARALEAIQKAVRKSSLSSEALKEIAQHVDLEGF
jgi:ribosomal protein L25 (general stress protein Ctc)